MWIASFYCYMGGLSQPLLANMGLFTGLLSLILCGTLLRSFRRNVCHLNFLRAWWMAWLIFLYASLLTAASQFVYFRYIDNGRLVNIYTDLLRQPEYKQLMTAMMPGENAEEVTQQALDLISSLSPIEITVELMIYNISLSFLLAVPVALIGITGRKTERNLNK